MGSPAHLVSYLLIGVGVAEAADQDANLVRSNSDLAKSLEHFPSADSSLNISLPEDFYFFGVEYCRLCPVSAVEASEIVVQVLASFLL